MANFSFLQTAFLICIYLTLNSLINLLNKYVIGIYGFKFPLCLSMCHQAFCFVGLIPVMICAPYRHLHKETIKRQGTGILSLSMFFAASLALNNFSLISIPLSLNQVIRASLPVVTALLAVFIEKITISRQELGSLVILSLGVMVAIYEGAATGNVAGVATCVMGTITNGCLISTTGKLMSEKVDSARLTFYMAPLTTMLLAPFFLWVEAPKLKAFLADHDEQVFVLVGITCVVALAYNIVHNLVIHVLSSVTTTVLGEVKIVGLLVLSAILLGEDKAWTPKMVVGVSTALVGFCLYSHVKMLERAKKVQQAATSAEGAPLLPKSAGDHSKE